MKVFISWSKERSKRVATLLDEFLQCVLQEVQPWISTENIESGDLWFSKISKSLSETKIGIVCLTPENKDNPWVMFEAGALMKGLEENKVHVLLTDLESTDVTPPLSQFNLTTTEKESLRKLVKSINNHLVRPLERNIFNKVFDIHWPAFEKELKKIIEDKPTKQQVVSRSDNEILSEILLHVRGLDRRLREVEHRDRNLIDPRRDGLIIHGDQLDRAERIERAFAAIRKSRVKWPNDELLQEVARRFDLNSDDTIRLNSLVLDYQRTIQK